MKITQTHLFTATAAMMLLALASSYSNQTFHHHQHRDSALAERIDMVGPINQDDNDGTIVSLIHELETQYIQDCSLDDTPRGFYGAFFQPCEFQFRASTQIDPVIEEETEVDSKDTAYPVFPCSDEASTLVSSPAAMHWFLNLTDFVDKDDWTMDDTPSDEDLLLWPDQCVGVMPRCYKLDDMFMEMQDALSRIFSSGFPSEATHVQVDCRGDAAQLSRVAHTFAEGLQLAETTTSLIFWIVTAILLSVVLGMWSVYACLRLCLGPRDPLKYPGCRKSFVVAADDEIAVKDD